MWTYEKKLQYPVNIKNANPAMARIIMTQLGGPDGEAGAAMRYLHQRYNCPYSKVTGILTDIGTEESEQICYQLPFLSKRQKAEPCEGNRTKPIIHKLYGEGVGE